MTLLGNFLLGSEVSDIRTALQVGDQLFIGNPGEPHLLLIDRYYDQLEPYLDDDNSIISGFVDEDGTWITKDELETTVKNDPDEGDDRGHSSFIRRKREQEGQFLPFGDELKWRRISLTHRSNDPDVDTMWSPEGLDGTFGFPKGTFRSWEENKALPTDEQLDVLANEGIFGEFEDLKAYRDRSTVVGSFVSSTLG